ncbi:MAG: cation:proton antiporter [Candidatus Aenigmarchaeota archaeon]|nr:cation:proton antiporter [Candidatus Aenigmarchaeota archaeon]
MIYDLVLITIIATVLAVVFWRFRQPTILAYLIAGMIMGPNLLNLVRDQILISAMSQLGVAFLLFLVGMQLNFNKMKNVGTTSLITGIGQIVFTAFFGYVISLILGFSSLHSLYIAIALTFSSTIIIIKLLSEKNDMDSLYGRIATGFLLVQDFVAIIILIFLSMLGTGDMITVGLLGETLLIGAGLFIAAIASSKYILPPVFNITAKSQELLFLVSISWCFLFVYVSSMLGFSLQIGAFLAGISLAPLPFCYEISGKIKPLRDFFIVLFFVLLGMQMTFSTALLTPLIILSLFVLIGNPLIVMTLMGLLGYRKRTSFFASLATAQISEFSLIIIAFGTMLGHISVEVSSLVTSVGIITIAISTYMITFNEKLYKIFSPILGVFEKRHLKEEAGVAKRLKNHIIVIGCHRMGYVIVDALKKMKKDVLVIDFNPDIIRMLKKEKIPYMYGDVTDMDILDKANIKNSKLIVSTLPDIDENKFLVKESKKYNVPVIVTANYLRDANELYCIGADYVILPYFLGGDKMCSLLKNFLKNPKSIRKTKLEHFKYLKWRMELGHEHATNK